MSGRAGLPQGTRLLYSPDDPPLAYLVRRDPLLTGRNITDVNRIASGSDGLSDMNITLDDAGVDRLDKRIAARHGGS